MDSWIVAIQRGYAREITLKKSIDLSSCGMAAFSKEQKTEEANQSSERIL
jgi:hypothetical protein